MTPKFLFAAVCFASLVTGLGLGVALDRTLFARSAPHPPLRGTFSDRVIAGLDLTEAQRARVLAIFEARRPQFLEIMKDVRPRLDVLREATLVEVRSELRPEQVARLEEVRRDWEKEREPPAARPESGITPDKDRTP